MIHTLEQNVLILTLFKFQFGDKTIKELFPDVPNVHYGYFGCYSGFVGDLDIQIKNFGSKYVFLMNGENLAAAIMPFGNEDMFVLCNMSGANYRIPIERVFGMLNFEDNI